MGVAIVFCRGVPYVRAYCRFHQQHLPRLLQTLQTSDGRLTACGLFLIMMEHLPASDADARDIFEDKAWRRDFSGGFYD
jgi:hypothetical protein